MYAALILSCCSCADSGATEEAVLLALRFSSLWGSVNVLFWFPWSNYCFQVCAERVREAIVSGIKERIPRAFSSHWHVKRLGSYFFSCHQGQTQPAKGAGVFQPRTLMHFIVPRNRAKSIFRLKKYLSSNVKFYYWSKILLETSYI